MIRMDHCIMIFFSLSNTNILVKINPKHLFMTVFFRITISYKWDILLSHCCDKYIFNIWNNGFLFRTPLFSFVRLNLEWANDNYFTKELIKKFNIVTNYILWYALTTMQRFVKISCNCSKAWFKYRDMISLSVKANKDLSKI